MNALEINPVTDPKTYARIFDESNHNWTKTPEWNLLFLRSQENHLNDLLHVNGYVFLNDVYTKLGFPRTPDGQLVGWFMDEGRNTRVSFNIQDHTKDEQPTILLDFNVDGIIYDKI